MLRKIRPVIARSSVKGSLAVFFLTSLLLFLPSPAVTNIGNPTDAPLSFFADDLDCQRVVGFFRAESLPPAECASPFGICSRGKLYGKLKATYEMTVDLLLPTGEEDVPFVSFFVGESAITMKNGDVIYGIDTGALDAAPPGTPTSGKFSTLLNFIDGTVGYLYIHGTTDFIAGTTTGFYSGLVCTE